MRFEVNLATGGVLELPDAEVIPPTQEQLQEQINNDARAYLTSTDWYVVRFAETGVAIPKDILDARQSARESVK